MIVWENDIDNVQLIYEHKGQWFFEFKNGHRMNSCTFEQAIDIIRYVEKDRFTMSILGRQRGRP